LRTSSVRRLCVTKSYTGTSTARPAFKARTVSKSATESKAVGASKL
jgi:hypothetical protein